MYRILTDAQRTYVVRQNTTLGAVQHARFRSTRAHKLAAQLTVSGSLWSVYGDRLPRENRLTVSQGESREANL